MVYIYCSDIYCTTQRKSLRQSMRIFLVNSCLSRCRNREYDQRVFVYACVFVCACACARACGRHWSTMPSEPSWKPATPSLSPKPRVRLQESARSLGTVFNEFVFFLFSFRIWRAWRAIHMSFIWISRVSWISHLSCSCGCICVCIWQGIAFRAWHAVHASLTLNHIHLTCVRVEWVIFRVHVGAYVCACGKEY